MYEKPQAILVYVAPDSSLPTKVSKDLILEVPFGKMQEAYGLPKNTKITGVFQLNTGLP